MNDYFFNVASALVSKLPSPLNLFSTTSDLLHNLYIGKNVTGNSFKLNPISEQFVNTELSRLNINKVLGMTRYQQDF